MTWYFCASDTAMTNRNVVKSVAQSLQSIRCRYAGRLRARVELAAFGITPSPAGPAAGAGLVS